LAPIIGLGEAANPILTVTPILLMILSGYTIGRIISKLRMIPSLFFRDLIYGNVILIFLFLSGFIIFGVLVSAANEYFTSFTYILLGLSVLAVYFLLKSIITILKSGGADDESTKIQIRKIRSLFFVSENQTTIFIFFGIALFVTLLVYQAAIIYYHPIYNEYDSMYRFLPISKSILLGNGLNHDFYLGSDINMRHPPFIQALNAWLIHSFEYSSIRMFPFYYVLFAAILVYSLTRNVLIKTTSNSESSFFGLIASSAFLITPALLVVSSRFSLQQDLGFIFMLTASFYFLSDIVRTNKPAKTTLLMLSASLALMALTREIGLVVGVAIFFLVPAIKYTEGNLKLRALFTVLSFLLPYTLSLKDLFEVGFINGTIIRLTALLLSNLAVFYILAQMKNQNKFSSLITPVSNFIYIVPLAIPIIFIVTNLLIFSGPFPIFTFSGEFSKFLPTYRQIFGITNPLQFDLSQTLQTLPRLDILFISVAMGSVFIFFKLVGLARIIYQLKNNYQYSLILVLLIFLLVTWAVLLQSGFQTSNVRYAAYFVPILSVILVIGMKIGRESSPYNKVICYGLIVFAIFYFLHFNLFIWNYQNHFGGFWVEPVKGSIITWVDVGIGAAIMGGLILIEIGGRKISTFTKNYNLRNYIMYAFVALLGTQIYVLFNSGIILASPQKMDQLPPSKWETNVAEVIDYLESAENGNVLAVRAPAIPFFTNRTSFDLFNPQVFSYNISSLLLIENSSLLKQKIDEMGIRYIVLPNQNNSLYYLVQNLMADSKLLDDMNTDSDFDRITFNDFNIYKYNVPSHKINLLDDEYNWKPREGVTVSQQDGNLNISVISNHTEKAKKLALLKTRLNLTERPLLLSLSYASNSSSGAGTFKVGIADRKEDKLLFNTLLNNTSGNLTNQTFIVPKNIGSDKPLEFRTYIVTDGPGKYFLNFKRIQMAYS
jgi:hypothetical protein